VKFSSVLAGSPSLAALTNAASGTAGTVAPGMNFVGYGSGIGPAILSLGALDSSGLLSNNRAGVQILFDNTPAPVVYVQQNQVSGIVPYDVANKQTAQVVVSVNGARSAPLTVNVTPAAPGIFSKNFSGSGEAVVFNQDGSVNAQSNPAAPGEIIVLYGTGEGQTSPAGENGKVATSVYPKPVFPVNVFVGTIPVAEILYAGAVPQQVAGIFQVNARLAANTPSGNQSLTVTVGPYTSKAGLTVWVR
jgi:uncharacterized protein (TIGR03437 family)